MVVKEFTPTIGGRIICHKCENITDSEKALRDEAVGNAIQRIYDEADQMEASA